MESIQEITSAMIEGFASYLNEEEKSRATIEKYLHDVKYFQRYVNGAHINKTMILTYKDKLREEFAVSSANSMIAALNSFLKFLNRYDLCVKQFRIQKSVYCPEEKELTKTEYVRLVEAAKRKGNERLQLLIQTICSTGIRVSELQYITVEAIKQGKAVVNCKGKTRTVFIVRRLQVKLLQYAKKQVISSGAVFITKTGKPLNRCYVWREMKMLCGQADVSPTKVFPHNLRHLFARTFYEIEKDIAKLADILGHGNINTTRIYIITTGMEHRRKMELMRLVI